MSSRIRVGAIGRFFLIALALLPASMIFEAAAAADDAGAHGVAPEANQKADINQPGPAVLAPRVTAQWTQPGVTQNPIAFTFDPRGNLYIVEAWRAGSGVLDNRNPPMQASNAQAWDLKMTSVEDRAAHIEHLIAGGFYTREDFTRAADKVRVVRDTDGDGLADDTHLFADGFNDELDGIAAGVLWHEGKVYLTNIPHLWLLQDHDGDGDADETTQGERVSLSYGYGIRWAFYGHDMHGLIRGPDGRIYFSVADRGYNVTTQEGKHLYGPDRGAVFRMWPDGSGLELYFEGLRNPQELAFDNYGNLFTGDNNCDAGDLARFVYLPEGGDCGWRQDVQSLPHRGPWLRERMWEPRLGENDISQPAWIIPPLANVGAGPSGIAHYPGTGDAFESNGSFLLCDFPSGIRHVQVEPEGASFKVTEDSAFIDGGWYTDVDWGYDGRIYYSDWGESWAANPDGTIKTRTNTAAHAEQAEVLAQVESLFANGFENLSDQELIARNDHEDQRVRLAVQFELAKRPSTTPALAAMLSKGDLPELARLHAVWTLGMQARQNPAIAPSILPGLRDPSEQVRAQSASTLGDLGYNATEQYADLLADESPIVQHHAALALGKTGSGQDIGPLLDLLDRNDNNDVAIRHAASYALSLIGDAEAIGTEAQQRPRAARLGAVLALRRLNSPLLADYLEDEDAQVAAEAARAIYDQRVMDAMPALAALADTIPVDRMTEPVMRRVIEANVRLADIASANRLVGVAKNTQAPTAWRVLALQELDTWSATRNREGVWGSWWPRPTQTMEPVLPLLAATLPGLFDDADEAVVALARLTEQHHLASLTTEQFLAVINDPENPDMVRLAALDNLVGQDRPAAIQVAAIVADAPDTPLTLKASLREKLLALDQDAAMRSYLHAMEQDAMAEKQQAVTGLAQIDDPKAIAVIANLADELGSGTLAPELKLEVLDAVDRSPDLPIAIRAGVQQYVQRNQVDGEPYLRDAVIAGGSVERGMDLFLNHEAAQCQRCHNVNGDTSVGPSLAGIGSAHDVNYLYRALVKPNADIAPGFAVSAVTLNDGQIISGRIVGSKSTPAELVLANADGVEQKVSRNLIKGVPVTSGQSLMPTMADKLNASELRDVLAYLVSLEGQVTQANGSAAPAYTGPRIVNPAESLPHAIWLPAVLMSIFVMLGVLLLATVLGGGKKI